MVPFWGFYFGSPYSKENIRGKGTFIIKGLLGNLENRNGEFILIRTTIIVIILLLITVIFSQCLLLSPA